MKRNIFAAVFTVIAVLNMVCFKSRAFAQDVQEKVTVDASTEDREVTVGNVDALQFGVHVRAENGHTAVVRAGNVRARFLENQLNAALYVFADGTGSLADVNTKNLTAEDEVNNYGAIIRVFNGGHAAVNTGSADGNNGVQIEADGNNSSVVIKTGDLNVSHIGLNFQSNDYAEIDVTTGNIHSVMEGIFNPYTAMAGNGGKVRVTAQNVIGENEFGIAGFASGTDSELRMKTNDIRGGYVALDLNAENRGKVLLDAGNVAMINTSTDPYSPAFSRRGVGGHSSGDGSELEFRISGSVFLSEIGNTTVGDINQQPSEGVFATANNNGNTVIRIGKDVTVKAEKTQANVCGIRTENAGGTVIVSTGSNVSAEVPGSQKAYGLYIINNASLMSENLLPVSPEDAGRYPRPLQDLLAKTAAESRTEISIGGDLSGKAYGLFLEPSADIKADVLVIGTISGGTAAVRVDGDITPENFDLTVWKIDPNSGGCAAVKDDGSCAEDIEAAIKYIIKADGSPDDGRLTDLDGKPLERSHGFPVAKAGDTVCFHSGAQRSGDCVTVSKGGAVSFTSESGHSIDFYRILDREGKLPSTGFSAQSAVSPALRPRELAYGSTGLTLQIPALDLMETIVSVPKTDGAYPVEWLGSEIGLLDGTALPGEGFSVLTGHNHLNSTEAGPFLFLRELAENDLILVSDDSRNIQRFHVSGNYLITPDGLDTLADKLSENTLMLLTCEDEAVEGGYLHRRVILAEEM